jgi:hypothetical protein
MEVGKIVDNIEKAAGAIMNDKDRSRFDMAAELDVITKFLQILQQAYVAIYVVMLRLTLVTPEDISQGRLEQLEQRIDQVDATGVGFDIDVISSRLRSLRETRSTALRHIMDKQPGACDWHMLLSAMDERDTPLINDLYTATSNLRRSISQLKRDPGSLKNVHSAVVLQAVEVRNALEKAQWVSNRVLGLSTVRFSSPQSVQQPQQRTTAPITAR